MAVWSIVNLSQISADLRFEAEVYKPKYLKLEKHLSLLKGSTLDSLSISINSGPFGSNLMKSTYLEDGVIVLRPFNIKDVTFEDANLVFISDEDIKAQGLKLYHPGDVAFARVGDIRCGVIPDYGRPITISPNIIVASVNRELVNPYFLAVYMNTSFGFMQIERVVKIVAQPTITVEAVKSIVVPKIPLSKQYEIEKIFMKALEKRKHSREYYSDAEKLLIHELGFSDIAELSANTFSTSFSEVSSANRFDSEYYHPEKMRVLSKLAKMHGKVIGEHFKSVRDLFNPTIIRPDQLVYNYDLTAALRFFLDDDAEQEKINELGSTKKVIAKNDIVISRLRSYLKEIAIVSNSASEMCLGSSEFIVLRAKDKSITPEALLVYLRSAPVQNILKWCQDGSNHPRFQEAELMNIKIPDKIIKIQAEISSLIKNAIKTYRDSRVLLEDAKSRVEKMLVAEQ